MLIVLIYEWTSETPIGEICFQYNLTEHTVIDWFRFIRDILIEQLILYNNGNKIGGLNTICEIDETCVARRKYQVGRIIPTVWLVGGILRSQNFQMFLEVVPNRSAQTLEEVILRNVEIGTTIITDKWRGYINLNAKGYIHKTINHSENFVDQNYRSINTQKIESRWCAFKRFLRSKGTNYKPHLDEYIMEYLYRKKNVNIFEELIRDISLQYPFD